MRRYLFISTLSSLTVLRCHKQDISSKDLFEGVIISQQPSKKISGGNQIQINTSPHREKIYQSLSELL